MTSAPSSSILVIDVGTSGLRAAIVRPDGDIAALEHRRFVPDTPAPGLVEFDAERLYELVLEVSRIVMSAAGPVSAVGITNQRASTIAWNARTGRPIGPAIGWQDLRTVGECIMAKAEHGLGLAPNQSATKAAWLLTAHGSSSKRDEIRIGTVDSWLTWKLSGDDRAHVTDHGNAAVTGLATMHDGRPRWNERAVLAMGIDESMLPRIVDTSGPIAIANSLPGAPPILAVVGDQQASLMGQSCVAPGMAKCTFGTGGMLDVVTGSMAPASPERTDNGTFPIIAWSRAGVLTWGAEAIMLSAGSCIDWLVDDMGLVPSAASTEGVAAECSTTDGVFFVPALLGLATPHWDYGARGGLFGLTRGSNCAHIVRAVLEGVAHRGADLLEATLADHPSLEVSELRIDGGMSRNRVFVRALADATGRPIGVSRVAEATTLGAAYLAGLANGTWSHLDDIRAAWRPSTVVEPTVSEAERASNRSRWAEAVTRVEGWIPDLSALDF